MRPLLLLILFAYALPAWSSDLSRLYSDATLQYWQGRYDSNIRSNFNRLVLGSLTPDERQKVRGVSLELPLRAPGDEAGNPISYYAVQHHIVIPIQSIKFFDDLTQAWGYAWSNNLNQDHILNYLSVLKYHTPPANGFSPPLVALGIPADAWKSDPKMDDVAQKALKSAILFIMAHELAHILYRHPGYGPGVTAKEAQDNEAQADRFANEIMRRIGVAPSGMVQMFLTFTYLGPTRGDYASDTAWQKFLTRSATHPVTTARLQALATDFRRSPDDFSASEPDKKNARQRVLYLADQIDGIAAILKQPDLQRFLSAKGRGLDPAMLSFHPGDRKLNSAPAQSFAGTYRGSFTHLTPDHAPERLSMTVDLHRRGNHVSGHFDFGFGNGVIKGYVNGKKMSITWSLGNLYGQGLLRQNQSESTMTGTIGYATSDSDAGQWELRHP